jgi:hypothetical protein
MFVEEACIVSDAEGCKEQAQKLYESYRSWCLDNGHKPMSSTAVAKEWRRLGFGKHWVFGSSVGFRTPKPKVLVQRSMRWNSTLGSSSRKVSSGNSSLKAISVISAT